MSARFQPKQEIDPEIPEPIVVFRYSNSPARKHESSDDHRVCLSLDWSRLQREAAADAHRAENISSPDANTITSSSEDTSAEGSRLQIACESEHSETMSHQSECSESSETMVSPVPTARRATIGSSEIQNLVPRTNGRISLRRWNTMIALENCEVPLVYHKNMARKFPVPARTPSQAEQRRRNTEAARLSRAKMKIAVMLMEKEQKELAEENIARKRLIAAKLVYANALRTLVGLPPTVQLIDLKPNGPGGEDFETE